MAAITPNVESIPFPARQVYEQHLAPTAVADGDTMPFRSFTTLTQADCVLLRADNNAAVVFTTGTNIVTIGVNVPPLAATQIKGILMGVI